MLPISCCEPRSYAPAGSSETTLSVVPRMYVSALPESAAGVDVPPPLAGGLSSLLLLPQAAANAANAAVQPNTANRCVRMFSAPLQGFGSTKPRRGSVNHRRKTG